MLESSDASVTGDGVGGLVFSRKRQAISRMTSRRGERRERGRRT